MIATSLIFELNGDLVRLIEEMRSDIFSFSGISRVQARNLSTDAFSSSSVLPAINHILADRLEIQYLSSLIVAVAATPWDIMGTVLPSWFPFLLSSSLLIARWIAAISFACSSCLFSIAPICFSNLVLVSSSVFFCQNGW